MHSYIIGNSGSGKSTLAQRLVQEGPVRHLDLDSFVWSEPAVRREHADALALLRAELDGAPAVVEGMYADLLGDLITPDDSLIWLDLPVDVCVAHCQARPFEGHKWDSAEAQDAFLPQLLDFVRGYPEREGELGRDAHQALFDRFAGAKERIVDGDLTSPG